MITYSHKLHEKKNNLKISILERFPFYVNGRSVKKEKEFLFYDNVSYHCSTWKLQHSVDNNHNKFLLYSLSFSKQRSVVMTTIYSLRHLVKCLKVGSICQLDHHSKSHRCILLYNLICHTSRTLLDLAQWIMFTSIHSKKS